MLGAFCESAVLLDDTYLLKGVKPSAAFDYVKNFETFKNWSLGGDSDETENWSSKRPFNVKAVSCSMASKETTTLGKVMVLWEINEEVKGKYLKCTYRLVTFAAADTGKDTLINTPTIQFNDEFKFVSSPDGTIVHRICNNYVNYGTFPIFVDQWVTEENRSIIGALSSAPDTEFENSKNSSGMDLLIWMVGGGSPSN